MLRAIALLLAGIPLLGADPVPLEPRTLPAPDQPLAPVEPTIKELDAERLRIGGVIFNRKTREIRFPAAVNLAGNELLEFAVVHANGKVHESLLVTDISATHLNLAFKLLRYPASPELYPLMEEDGSVSDKFPEVPADVKAGARVLLGVEWEQDGAIRRAALNEWISHGSTGQSMPADPWVYGGSMIHEGKFQAELSGNIAAIFLSNTALLNYSGNDNQSDEVWLPFPGRVPAVGTKVTVTIAPHLKPSAKP
jgi:hypothetical protein